MVVEIACTCGDLPPHSHIGSWRFDDELAAANSGTRTIFPRYVDTGEIRISVDWKAVARELATSRLREGAEQ